MPNTVTLSSDLRITIPQSVADAAKWSPGQQFALIPRHDSVVIVPVPTLDELHGIAEGADTSGYRDRDDRY